MPHRISNDPMQTVLDPTSKNAHTCFKGVLNFELEGVWDDHILVIDVDYARCLLDVFGVRGDV